MKSRGGSNNNFVTSMRDGAQAMLDAHRTRISQQAEARQLLPLQQQRTLIREGLIKYGTDCNANDADPLGDGDQSPITTSGAEGREFARNLWSTGADFGPMLQQGAYSPLVACVLSGQVTTAEVLLQAADHSSENGIPSPALLACLEQREGSLRLSPLMMIVSIGKNLKDFPGLRQGQEDCARLLLKYGARPDACDVIGKTVVHYGAGKMATSTSIKIVDMCIRAHSSAHLFGKHVELYGLSNASDMNGLRGIGRGFIEENNRRAVYLFDKNKEVAVKPENIRLVVLEDDAAATATATTATPIDHGPPKTPLVDIQDRLGSVALHELVMSNRDDVAKFLLFQHNASYDVAELDAGCTPWSMATINTCMTSVCPVVVAASVKRGRKQQKEITKKCRHCSKMESDNNNKPLMVCSKCKVAVFCSRECQVAAWKAGHRDECKTLLQDQTDGIRLVGTSSDYQLMTGHVPFLLNAKSGQAKHAGKYQRPFNIKVNERFYIKIQYSQTNNGPLLVYDKTRSCCFYIQSHQTGYQELTAKVLAQTACNGLKSYFQASFDAQGVCTVYPGTSALKQW